MVKISWHEFVKRRVCYISLISLFDRVTGLVDKGKSVHMIYLDFHKAFEVNPYYCLISKCEGIQSRGNPCNLDAKLVEKPLVKIISNGSVSNTECISNGVFPGLGSIHLFLINDLDDRIEGMFIKAVSYTKLGGVASLLEDMRRIKMLLLDWRNCPKSTS